MEVGSDSTPIRFKPRVGASGTPRLGGKVNARAGLHAADKREICCILQGIQCRLFGILACSLVTIRT